MSWTTTPKKPTRKAKWQLPMRPHPKTKTMQYYLEGELQEKFIEKYPKHTNLQFMTWFGIGFSTLQRFKRAYGLNKDTKAVRKIQARNAKRTCEKNGYYDSLRGKPISEACQEGARKKRESGWNSFAQIRLQDPKKYKRMHAKIGKIRTETCRKERMRIRFGLPQKTKLHVTLEPMQRKAINQKYTMIKRCNYFADKEHPTWVLYDSQTKRSAQREATAIARGLKIVQGDED